MKVFCLRLMLSGSPLYALTKDKPLLVPDVDVLITSQERAVRTFIVHMPAFPEDMN